MEPQTSERLCFRRLRLPEFLNSQYMKVIRLSAPPSCHLYPQGISRR